MKAVSPYPRNVAVAALLLLAAAVAGCANRQPAPVALPGGVHFSPTGFTNLPGWSADRTDGVLAAFIRHCPSLLGGKEIVAVAGETVAPAVWQPICDGAISVPPGDATGAQTFFQTWFVPFEVSTGVGDQGAFTGYYEASLKASPTPDERFTVPIYRRPPDLVTIDLGKFRSELRGRLGGRLDGPAMVPYWTRAQIDAGALSGRGLELLWADDTADMYFLEVQGSGRATLPDGSTVPLSFDGQNGQPYVSLGTLMVERGLLARDAVSMQSIKAWLRAHPAESRALMEENPSFVFFKQGTGEGPTGTAGTALTPGRSMAVDPAFVPLGLPVWIDVEDPGEPGGALRRLMMAEDTGSAIRGPVRGDVFWGYGDAAASRAGAMRGVGRLAVLVPKPTSARLATKP